MFIKVYNDNWIPNLLLLLKERISQEIIFMSSNTVSLTVATHKSFCIMPIANDEKWWQYELILVERYLL